MSSSGNSAGLRMERSIADRSFLQRVVTDDSRRTLAVIIALILAVLVLPPIGILIQQSLVTTAPDGSIAGYTFAHYARLLDDPRMLESVWNTFVFGLGSTLLSLVLGGILAWLVERTNAPLRGLAYITTIISMGTPYVLYVVAWLFLLGRAGPVNDLYRSSHRFVRRADRRELDVGHDPHRGVPVVAAGLPSARLHIPRVQCGHGGSGADERRQRFRHDPPRLHPAGHAGDPCARAVRLHPRDRGVRRARAGRHARQYQRADDRDLL